MLPTPRGALLIAVGVVLYMLGWQSLIGWFYVADSLVWAALLVSLIAPRLMLRGLDAQRRLVALTRPEVGGICEGDAVRVTLEVENRGTVPAFLLIVEEQCPLAAPERQVKRFLIDAVLPRQKVVTQYEEACYRRGEHHFGPLLLSCAAPFGLFRATTKRAAALDVLVYPQIFPFAQDRRVAEPQEGTALPLRGRGGGDFRGARDYQQGDSVRYVHWRSSARRGRTMVKESDPPQADQVGLLFDPVQAWGEGKETTLEYSIKIAASLARSCFRRGVPFRMAPPALTHPHPGLRPALEYLARLDPSSYKGPSLDEFLRAPGFPGQLIVLVSAADPRGPAIVSRWPRSRLRAVIVFHQFAPQREDKWRDAFHGSGVPVIACGPGQIEATLDALAERWAKAEHGKNVLPFDLSEAEGGKIQSRVERT